MRRLIPADLIPALVLTVAACGNGGSAGPSPPPSGGGPPGPPVAPAHLLVVTHTTGFRHEDSIPAAEAALQQIGQDSGLFDVAFVRTVADVRDRLTPAGLSGIDAVFFANTTGDLGIPDLPAFLDWIASGKAFLGAHSASDTYHGSPAYLAMLGGEFVTHGAEVDADVRVAEPANPAVAHLGSTFRIRDEWYRLTLSGGARTVLLKFDRNPPDGVGAAGAAVDLPLSWQKAHGSGRVFYTALGHPSAVWGDSRFRTHLREGLRWALAR